MSKKVIALILAIGLGITGCMPFLGGNFIVRDNRFDSNDGMHTLEMQQGVTVKQLYDAIKKAINDHPKEFDVRADDYGDEKSIVWAYSNKYNKIVTFEAVKRGNNVYLGVKIKVSKDDKKSMQKVYYLEDMVLNNL